MIIKVKQTKSIGKNEFEIRVNDEVKYLAGAPWLKIEMPLRLERARKCVLTDADERVLFTTHYNLPLNIKETIIPMKWVITGEQKSKIYEVFDGNGEQCGVFYKLTKGLLDSEYVIEYGDYILKTYDISAGKTRNVVIYKDDVQVAELVKPVNVADNLDTYYIYLLDEYAELEQILSFFAVFFDRKHYNNSGEAVKGEYVGVRYSYSKNNKFYSKKWIPEHFGGEAAFAELNAEQEKIKKNFKKHAKIILLINGILWLIALIVLAVLWLNGYFG